MVTEKSCYQNNDSLFQEEMSACVAVPMCYVMDASDHLQFVILLPYMLDIICLLH